MKESMKNIIFFARFINDIEAPAVMGNKKNDRERKGEIERVIYNRKRERERQRERERERERGR